MESNQLDILSSNRMKYAVLLNPSHGRVYFENSLKIARTELSFVLSSLPGEYDQIEEATYGSLPYITFVGPKRLDEKVLKMIFRLSFLYALFTVKEIDGESYLLPLSDRNDRYINSNISSMLKYSGKTNEVFTRMMLNVALASSNYAQEDAISLLDPIAGKGTTLYEGLVMGHNCYGVEISEKVVLEAYNFMKKYLESEKYKHTTQRDKINGNGLKALKYSFQIGKTKEDWKDKNTKQWVMVAGNSALADKFYKKNTFHILVGDLPYGVQHGNVAGGNKQGGFTRNPKELIDICAKAWLNVLKPGGVMVLAWNSFLLSHKEFADILTSHGFTVLSDGGYQDFEHRVDQAIRRDIIVAKKI